MLAPLLLTFSVHLAPPADPFTRLTLENGVTVAILHVENAPKQSFLTFLPLGLYSDPAHRAQFSHLAEHLTIRGTDPYDLWSNGLELNGETTGAYLRLDSYAEPEKWRTALERHATWVTTRKTDAELLEREKERILGELDATVPNGYTHKWAMAAWSQVAGAGLEHAAVRGDIEGATVEEAERYLAECMPGPSAVHVVAVGPVAAEEVTKALRELFGKLPAKEPAKDAAPEVRPLATGDLSATWDLDARHYLEWYPLPAIDPATRAAAQLLAQQLTFALATSNDPLLAGGKAFASFDLATPGGRAITISAAIDAKTDVAKLRQAIRTRLDHLFDVNPFQGPETMIRQTLQELGRLPDFDALRQFAGGRGDLVEAQTALFLSMAELQLDLTIPEFRAELEKLDGEALKALAAKCFDAKNRSSLLL